MKLIIGVLVVAWLVIGAAAAANAATSATDRAVNCKTGADTALTDRGRPAQLRRGQPEGEVQGSAALELSPALAVRPWSGRPGRSP